MAIGWFPRYSETGQVTFQVDGVKYRAQFDGPNEIWDDGNRIFVNGVPNGMAAGNYLATGAGRIATGIPHLQRITTNWLSGLGDGIDLPALNPDGEFFYVTNPQTNSKTIIWHGRATLHTGPIGDLRASRQALVWSEGSSSSGVLLSNPSQTVRLSVLSEEFRPIPIDTPEGPWVLNHTQTGIILRPFGSNVGFRYDNGGQAYFPDAICLGNTIHVIFTNDHGVQETKQFKLTDQRNAIRDLPTGPIVVVPPPVTPPAPEKPSNMPIAPNVLSTIQAVFSAHPEINTTVDVERGKITDYVVLALGGFPWGRKDRDRDPNNNNNSDDALCYALDAQASRYEIYDIINGSNGAPTFSYSGTVSDGEVGFFRAVPGAVPKPDPGVPGPIGSPTVGVSPEQLAEAIAALKSELQAEFAKQLAELPKPVCTYTLPKLRVVGKTEVSGWHQHKIDLEVVEVK